MKGKKFWVFLTISLMLTMTVFAVIPVWGQTETKLISAAVDDEDWFGFSVALSDDGMTALVGAYWTDFSAGAAYVFTWDGMGWGQQTELTASLVSGDDFGYSVALSADGTTALVGAYGDDLQKGAAYVFTSDGTAWSQQAKLTASDAAALDWFGSDVALSADGTTALVGAYSDDDAGSASGSAYVFTSDGTTWSQQAKLTASDASINDRFGFSVALSDDGRTALVGAYGDEGFTGAAYVFTSDGTTWSQQAKLIALGTNNVFLGWSVALSGDGFTALAGAHYDDEAGLWEAGAAYVFTSDGTTWSQQARLIASDFAADANFGCAVELSTDGATALIGTSFHNNPSLSSGAAYVFTWDETAWSQIDKLTPSTGAIGDEFGQAVALNGDGAIMLVGSPYDDEVGLNAGAVYVYVYAPITTSETIPSGVSLFSNALWSLPLALLIGVLMTLHRQRTLKRAQ